jgi:hypothetical protein
MEYCSYWVNYKAWVKYTPHKAFAVLNGKTVIYRNPFCYIFKDTFATENEAIKFYQEFKQKMEKGLGSEDGEALCYYTRGNYVPETDLEFVKFKSNQLVEKAYQESRTNLILDTHTPSEPTYVQLSLFEV